MIESTNIGQSFTKMAITFNHIHSISTQITFSESSPLYLSNDVSFTWFGAGPDFPIVFSNDVIGHSSDF